MMKGKWRLWLAAAAAIIIVLLLARALINMNGEKPAVSVLPKAVSTQLVAKVSKQPTLALTGTVEAVQEAVVSARVAGRVVGITVENGDAVAAGQILVQVDDSDYQNALAVSQAALAKAEANLALVQDNYSRQEVLFDSSAISASDFEGVKASLAAAKADVSSAEAAVDNARMALQNTSIGAPIDGVATDCNVKIGQFLSPGAPLLKVLDISSVHAVVNVEQGDLAVVKPGQAARVTADAYGSRLFNGTVDLINPVAVASTRVFETKIRVANGARLLRPGMFVKVEIDTGGPAPVIAVPQNAVVGSGGLYYVFLIDGDRAKRQQVQVGRVIGQLVEITSGLEEGQRVVLTDVGALNDQDRVSFD